MRSKLLSLLFLTAAAAAQPRHVRFLAVGDAPPFRHEIRDGVSYELEPPEGSIPPREVIVNGASVKLRLGMIGPPLEAPSGKGPLDLRKKDAATDAAPWLQIATPEDGDILLWRDAKAGSWAQARALSLPEDAPAGSVRFVNIAPFAANVVVGAEKLILAPGKSLSRNIPAGGELAFQVLLQEKSGKLKRMFSTNLVSGPGERTLAVIYRADAQSPRRPIKIAIRREAASAPVAK